MTFKKLVTAGLTALSVSGAFAGAAAQTPDRTTVMIDPVERQTVNINEQRQTVQIPETRRETVTIDAQRQTISIGERRVTVGVPKL